MTDLANVVQSNVGVINVTSVDIDGTSEIMIDGGSVSIDGTNDSNITVTGSAKDLDIAVVGGSTQELRLSSAGTGSNAISLQATAGGITLDAGNGTATFKDNGVSLGTITSLGYTGNATTATSLVGVNATVAELNILDETAVGTPGALAIEASAGDDGVLVYDASENTISWKTLATVCFLKGTKITLSDGIPKNIEEIKENDNLLSYRFHDLDSYNQDLEYLMNWYSKDYRGTNSETLVKQLWENETTQYYIINDKLKVTPEHLLFIRRNGNYEWYPSKNVKKGFYLLTSENNFEEIVTIELVDEKTKVYNLKLQGIMNYYASDYLVHCSSKCDECENNK